MVKDFLVPGYINHLADNEIISQRISDGYINATAMCKATGKEWRRYFELSTTKLFIYQLSHDAGLNGTVLIKQIGLSEAGGNPHLQGTWVHPQIAIHLAQWLSPKFAVCVTQWVMDWMSENKKNYDMPYHLKRYYANLYNVPYGYFSILNEICLYLIGPLEMQGYIVSSNHVPDISLGKMFSRFLRDNGYPVDKYPMYQHQYPNGRNVPAKAYPNELLALTHRYYTEEWLLKHSQKYFKERDVDALPYLNKLLSLPNMREVMALADRKIIINQ